MTRQYHSFSPTLSGLHETLASLRRKGANLQHELRERYRSPSLTLKNHIKFGPGAHVKVKDGVALLDADHALHAVLRTNSTRLYVTKVRSSFLSKTDNMAQLWNYARRNGAVSSARLRRRKKRSVLSKRKRCRCSWRE